MPWPAYHSNGPIPTVNEPGQPADDQPGQPGTAWASQAREPAIGVLNAAGGGRAGPVWAPRPPSARGSGWSGGLMADRLRALRTAIALLRDPLTDPAAMVPLTEAAFRALPKPRATPP